jgi:hypothetical protein
VHDWAFFAFHCRVAAVPIATLLLVATRLTAGFADALELGSVSIVWLDADCPQAASAANAAPARAQRMKRELSLRRLWPNWLVLDACEKDSVSELELRPSKFITRLQDILRGDDCVHRAAGYDLGSAYSARSVNTPTCRHLPTDWFWR